MPRLIYPSHCNIESWIQDLISVTFWGVSNFIVTYVVTSRLKGPCNHYLPSYFTDFYKFLIACGCALLGLKLLLSLVSIRNLIKTYYSNYFKQHIVV